MIELIAPYSLVTVHAVGLPLKGVVVGIIITGGVVRYTVGHWSGTDWRETTFDAEMVAADRDRPLKIGFRGGADRGKDSGR